MKKTYMIPTLTVVKMQSSRIMAGSFKGLLGDDGVDGSVSLSPEETFIDWESVEANFEQPPAFDINNYCQLRNGAGNIFIGQVMGQKM